MIRSATPADFAAIAAIAAVYGFDELDSGVDVAYLHLVMRTGRLAVAEVRTDSRPVVVGFGGTVDSFGAAMVTDLFVLEQFHRRGLGGRLLQHLVGDRSQRMTFSSNHPAALPTYQRLGMQPRWRLRYLRGGIRHLQHRVDVVEVVDVSPEMWAGSRRELAHHWRRRDARLLHIGDALDPTGTAIVTHDDRSWTLQRMETRGDHATAMASVMAALPERDALTTFVPAWSHAATLLDDLDFEELDHDVCCTTADVVIPSTAVVLHPALA